MKVKEMKMAEQSKSYNFSTSCVMPMLGKPWSWYGDYLLSFYIGDKNRPEHDNNILALFSFADDDNFRKVEEELREHTNFVLDYDPSPDTVMFVFSVPPEYQDDYDLFKEGKYSHFSIKLKNAILGNRTSGPNFEILTKSRKRRYMLERDLDVSIDPEAELLDPPNEYNEIYGY